MARLDVTHWAPDREDTGVPDIVASPQADADVRQSREPWRVGGVLSALVTLVLLVPGVWRSVVAYHLNDDDFSVVFNSCTPYFDLRNWTHWFTQGYSNYFVNYPGWPALQSNFARPVLNLSFYLEGMLAPSLGEPAFLIAGYLALFASVFALNGVIRTYAGAGAWTAAALSVAVGLSPVWYWSLDSGSSATNTLALAFSIGALLFLDPVRGVPRRWRLALCVALQVLAIASHETAAVIPFVCVALLFALAPRRPRLGELLPFALPVAYFVLERLLLRGTGGVYAFSGLGPAQVAKRLAGFVLMPVLPSDIAGWLSAPTRVGAAAATSFALVSLANVALVLVVVFGFRRRPGFRAWAMVAAVAMASVPGVIMGKEPRFHGLGLAVGLIAVLYFSESWGDRRWRSAVVALVLVSQMTLFLASVALIQDQTVARLRFAGEFYDATRTAVQRTRPRMVVLENDTVGGYGALFMLRMAQWPHADGRLVVVNSYTGDPSDDARSVLATASSTLTLRTTFGAGQSAVFPGAIPDFSLPSSGFQYSDVQFDGSGAARAFRASGEILPGSTLVVGADPRTGSMRVPRTF